MQELIGTSAAAILLGVHPATVTRMVDDGRLAPVGRLGDAGALIFDRVDVERLRDERATSVEAVSAGTVVIQQADEACQRALNPDRLRGVRPRTP